MSEQSAFRQLAPLYDTLMHEVPYEEWARYLERLLQERQAQPKRALDLACGTGNVAEHLHAMGMEVVGVDVSPAMIEEARRKAAERQLPIRYYVQDAAALELPEVPFDLCVSLFDSLNYITEPERLAKAFQRVAAHLVGGGLFIFDLNTEYALANRFFDEVHWQYAYREQEVRAFLTQAGFDQIAVYHAYTLRPPAPYSDRLFYVARRSPTAKRSPE